MTHDGSISSGSTSAGGGERWFRMYDWLIDTGVWAKLSDPARAVLPVLARHATHGGYVSLSSDRLQELSGLGRSAAYDAVAELIAHPARLLSRRGRGALVVFPGHAFATSGGGGGPQPRTEPPPSSAVTDGSSARAGPKSAEADTIGRVERHDVVSTPRPTWTGPDHNLAVALLIERGGFEPHDATATATRYGLEKVRNAVDNADWQERHGGFKSGRRAYISCCLRDGYSLYEGVEKERRSRENLARKVAALINARKHLGHGDLFIRAFGTATHAVEMGRIRWTDLVQRTDDQVYDDLVAKAHLAVQIQESKSTVKSTAGPLVLQTQAQKQSTALPGREMA